MVKGTIKVVVAPNATLTFPVDLDVGKNITVVMHLETFGPAGIVASVAGPGFSVPDTMYSFDFYKSGWKVPQDWVVSTDHTSPATMDGSQASMTPYNNFYFNMGSWLGTGTPIAKWHYDAVNDVCVQDPNGEFDSQAKCEAAHPPKTTTPPITGTGPPTPPGAYTGGLNANDIVSYVGQWIKWLGDEAQYIEGLLAAAVWDALPRSITDWFGAWGDFFAGVKEFFTTPGAFYRKHQAALWESGSPPPIPAQMDNSQAEIKSRLATYNAGSGGTFDLIGDMKAYLNSAAKGVTDLIAPPSDVTGAEATSFSVSAAALGAMLTAVGINLIPELIPTEDLTGVAFLINTILTSLGIPGFINDYWGKKYDVSVGQLYLQYLNEKYHPSLPGIGELIRQRQRNLITNQDFTASASRATGLNTDRVGYAYKAALAVPGFEDVILYHHRHPNETVDYGSLQDWMGINYVDYKKYFDERQYVDIPIRTLKMMYQSGAIPLSDVDSRIRRQGIRSDILQGDTISDFQIYHNYVTESQEATL